MPTLAETEAFVRKALAGQEDKAGVSMADHAMRVVANLEGEDEITLHAAWLHDILEDTKETIDHYPPEVIEVVDLLTHRKKEMTYAEYIDRICQSGNLRAIKVKLADQQDNLDPRRWMSLNRYMQQALRKRYAGVREKLLEAAICLT